MFLSAVWTLILTAPIHCRASIGEQVMQCYISPNLMKKLIYIVDDLKVKTFQQMLVFELTIPLSAKVQHDWSLTNLSKMNIIKLSFLPKIALCRLELINQSLHFI